MTQEIVHSDDEVIDGELADPIVLSDSVALTPALDARQREWIEGLRELADFLEAHPAILNPVSTFMMNQFVYGDDAKTRIRMMVRGTGKWEKTPKGDFFCLSRPFGPHTVDINTSREEVCEKVQVGTREVEVQDPEILKTVPMVTVNEPVYEWECHNLLDGEA